MQHYQQAEDRNDRLKSGIITAAIWTALLLFLFWYKVVEKMPAKKEVETRMLINFGDSRNGNGAEEPANQKGSLASATAENSTEIAENSTPEPVESPVEISQPEKRTPKPAENIISGKNEKVSTKKVEKPDKNLKSSSAKSSQKNTNLGTKSSAKSGNSATGTAKGDGKGTAAIGNLLKGKGTKSGSQGSGGTAGNPGDPLGGEGNGDSKIGIDRKLVGFIPGTMGRGGQKPANSCNADGEIRISYTVDKAGNVVSARRSGGIKDACAVSSAISWVKKYVKAERATTSSTGTYTISF